MPKLDTYVTVAEAARKLGVSRARVYQLVAKGQLRARKKVPAVSRISMADVEARLRAPTEAAAAAAGEPCGDRS